MDNGLKDWTIAYVKNRDLTFRKLLKFEEHNSDSRIDFKFKDKDQSYFITEELSDVTIEKAKKYENKIISCLNTEENLKFLLKNWKKLSEIKNLSFLFVNMKNHEKWVINPHTHSLVSDPDSIEPGLRAMFDTANGTFKEPPKGKKKASMFEESEGSDDEDPEAEG